MKSILLTLVCCALGTALLALHADQKPIVRFQNFTQAGSDGASDGWTPWSPRAEIAPVFSVDANGGRGGGGALKIETAGSAKFGAWRKRVEGLQGGRTYRFAGFYRAKNVSHERRSVIVRLEWLDAGGKAVRPPDYAIDIGREGAWTRIEHITSRTTSSSSLRAST